MDLRRRAVRIQVRCNLDGELTLDHVIDVEAELRTVRIVECRGHADRRLKFIGSIEETLSVEFRERAVDDHVARRIDAGFRKIDVDRAALNLDLLAVLPAPKFPRCALLPSMTRFPGCVPSPSVIVTLNCPSHLAVDEIDGKRACELREFRSVNCFECCRERRLQLERPIRRAGLLLQNRRP